VLGGAAEDENPTQGIIRIVEPAKKTLWERFQECRAQGLMGIPRDELLEYMRKTAEAIDHLNHDLNVIHCDIRPQNIVCTNGEVQLLKSAYSRDMGDMISTVSAGFAPTYAAPEHFDGVVSRASDRYSLAVVYQEMLTGERPYWGSNLLDIIHQLISEQPNLASLTPHDQKVISRALSRSLDERFPSCKEFVEALANCE
jgi:serine/threonine protein kinase